MLLCSVLAKEAIVFQHIPLAVLPAPCAGRGLCFAATVLERSAMFFRLVALNCRYTHSCLALYYLRAALVEHFGPACRIEIKERTINDPYYETLLARYECSQRERPAGKPRFGTVIERLFGQDLPYVTDERPLLFRVDLECRLCRAPHR